MVLRRLNRNSEPQASIESGQYTLQYVILHLLYEGGGNAACSAFGDEQIGLTQLALGS